MLVYGYMYKFVCVYSCMHLCVCVNILVYVLGYDNARYKCSLTIFSSDYYSPPDLCVCVRMCVYLPAFLSKMSHINGRVVTYAVLTRKTKVDRYLDIVGGSLKLTLLFCLPVKSTDPVESPVYEYPYLVELYLTRKKDADGGNVRL